MPQADQSSRRPRAHSIVTRSRSSRSMATPRRHVGAARRSGVSTERRVGIVEVGMVKPVAGDDEVARHRGERSGRAGRAGAVHGLILLGTTRGRVGPVEHDVPGQVPLDPARRPTCVRSLMSVRSSGPHTAGDLGARERRDAGPRRADRRRHHCSDLVERRRRQPVDPLAARPPRPRRGPASRSTRRCRETPGRGGVEEAAISPAVIASRASRSTMVRRVGSARASKDSAPRSRVTMGYVTPSSVGGSQRGVGLGAAPSHRLRTGGVARPRAPPRAVGAGGEGRRERPTEGVTGTDRVPDVDSSAPVCRSPPPRPTWPRLPRRSRAATRARGRSPRAGHLRLVDDDRVGQRDDVVRQGGIRARG